MKKLSSAYTYSKKLHTQILFLHHIQSSHNWIPNNMNLVLYNRSNICLLLSLTLLSLLVSQLGAFQGGVPCEVLATMQPPKSSGPAQQSRSPYGIRVTNENGRSVTEFSDNRVYTVEIYGRCGTWTPIEGFLLVSRDKNTREIIGEFLKDDSNYWQASHYPCRDVKLGSVTHYIAYKRLFPVKFHWRLNSYIAERRLGQSNNIEFEAIIYRSSNFYWKGLTWPESPANNCFCDDKVDVDCKSMVKNALCDSESIRDNCAFSCNNCTVKSS